MKLVKHRGFLVWNFDKEEDWLNQMANDAGLFLLFILNQFLPRNIPPEYSAPCHSL